MLDLLDLNLDDISSNPNANDAFNELYEVTNEVIDRHIPARRLTDKEFKRRHKRWITLAILNSIGRKNKLYKKYIKCKNTVTRNQIFQEYKTLKNQITQIIRVSKKQHFARYFSANNNNLRKLCDGIKELVNIKPKNNASINYILVNGKTVTAPKEIANNFNIYFTKIADNILSEKKYHGNKHYSVYLTNPIPNSFVFRPCDKMEIDLLISKLDINQLGPMAYQQKFYS